MSASPQPLVLVVESDDHTREKYAGWLTLSGFCVAQVSHHADAFEKAVLLKPDLIAAAFGAESDFDGYRLCQNLRTSPRTQSIPVIVVGEWRTQRHVERARQAGCDAVLVKPCSPEILLGEVRRLMKLPPPVTFADVDIRAEPSTRPARVPDYEAEQLGFSALASELADNPRNMLQKLVEVAAELCGAHTAGISLLEGEVFRWEAVAGVHKGRRAVAPCRVTRAPAASASIGARPS